MVQQHEVKASSSRRRHRRWRAPGHRANRGWPCCECKCPGRRNVAACELVPENRSLRCRLVGPGRLPDAFSWRYWRAINQRSARARSAGESDDCGRTGVGNSSLSRSNSSRGMVFDGVPISRQGVARTQAVNPGLELAGQGVQCKAGDEREEAGERTRGRRLGAPSSS